MSDGLNNPLGECRHGNLIKLCSACREIAALEDENKRLRAALSSGVCSAHSPPDPLNCGACNMVQRLTDSVEEYIGQVERLHESEQHWRVKAECYGNMVHGCSPALEAAGFPVDRSRADGAVGGVRRAVEALTAENARLRADSEWPKPCAGCCRCLRSDIASTSTVGYGAGNVSLDHFSRRKEQL